MCKRIFLGCAVCLLSSARCRFPALAPFGSCSGNSQILHYSDGVEGSSFLSPFGSSAMTRYVHVEDKCKVWLGNLDRHAEPKAIAAWVRKVCKVELAISCKVVIRGRSCIRRGLDALTTGGGPPPIGDAPLTGGLVPHMVFRKRAQLVALQTRRGEPPRSSRLQHSNCGSPIYRFSTSSCPSG